MSHFTRLQTVIRNEAILCDVLTALHHQFRQGENLLVRGYQGTTQEAQVVVNTNCPYDIGFQRQADGSYGAVADWDWGIRRQAHEQFQKDRFLEEINQQYGHLSVKAEVVRQGLLIESERVLENGDIELIVCERI